MSAHDPFTGARITDAKTDPKDPRLGTPPDKFGALAQPVLTADRRQSVMILLFPPEALRDQPLPVIEQVIAGQARGILKTIAQEIYRSYTSDPVAPDAARTAGEALLAHADAMKHGGAR